MRKILTAIFVVGLVATIAGAGIYAYFSDTETSTSNIFTAGTLDLKVRAGIRAFTLGLKFNAGATNDIQGDILTTTITFTLNQHSSQ